MNPKKPSEREMEIAESCITPGPWPKGEVGMMSAYVPEECKRRIMETFGELTRQLEESNKRIADLESVTQYAMCDQHAKDTKYAHGGAAKCQTCWNEVQRELKEAKKYSAELKLALAKKDSFIKQVIGFCVALRQDKPCWEDHQDAGVLFARAKAVLDEYPSLSSIVELVMAAEIFGDASTHCYCPVTNCIHTRVRDALSKVKKEYSI